VQEYDKFFDGKVVEFSSVAAVKDSPKGQKMVEKDFSYILRKDAHLVIAGPNGIGKSTLMEKLASGKGKGFVIPSDIIIGYYKQDFSNFDMDQKAYDALKAAMKKPDDHDLRSTAAGFLLDGKLLDHQIKALSEGQKGLLSFCRLMLMHPGLLILDEPTNHINFRHLPIIAEALDKYQGAMIMVSHIPEFVKQIRVDQTIDLEEI
jgi:ATP-binding cassette subfamily F protein 3